MNNITDLVSAAIRYAQHSGYAPTLDELNREGAKAEKLLQDKHGASGYEPFSQPKLDEAVRVGCIVCDAEGRIYALPETYWYIDYESASAESLGLTYKEYIKKMLNEGYAWIGEQLMQREGMEKEYIIRVTKEPVRYYTYTFRVSAISEGEAVEKLSGMWGKDGLSEMLVSGHAEAVSGIFGDKEKYTIMSIEVLEDGNE